MALSSGRMGVSLHLSADLCLSCAFYLSSTHLCSKWRSMASSSCQVLIDFQRNWTNFMTSPMSLPSTCSACRISLRMLEKLSTFLDFQFLFWSEAVHDFFHMHTVLTCLFTSEESGTFCVNSLRNVFAHVLIAERAVSCHKCTHNVLFHAIHHVTKFSIRTA